MTITGPTGHCLQIGRSASGMDSEQSVAGHGGLGLPPRGTGASVPDVDSLAKLSAHVGVGVAELLAGASADEFEELFSVFGVPTLGKVRIRADIAKARAERVDLSQRVVLAEAECDALRQQLATAQGEAAHYKAEAAKNKDFALKIAEEADRYKALSEELRRINERLSAKLLNASTMQLARRAACGGASAPPAYNPALVSPCVVQAEFAGGSAPLAQADAVALAAVRRDTTLQVGQRINIPGYGFGTYMGFEQKFLGANLHRINFEGSGPQTLDLKTPAWAQCQTPGAHWVVQDGVLYGGCVFRVEHAGTPGVNGYYRVEGLHMGESARQYCKVDNEAVTIKKYASVGQWSIECDGGRYSNFSESLQPPQGGWIVVTHSGAAPAPRLVYVS